MRSRAALLLALLLALLAAAAAAPAAASGSPEAVVRAWSRALNANDNEGAALLFAPGAVVIQGGVAGILRTHAEALLWNSGLPCAGRIVAMTRRGDVVRAVFVLGDRPAHHCDGPGEKAAALFHVRRGKIVGWAQIPVPEETPRKKKPPKGAI